MQHSNQSATSLALCSDISTILFGALLCSALDYDLSSCFSPGVSVWVGVVTSIRVNVWLYHGKTGELPCFILTKLQLIFNFAYPYVSHTRFSLWVFVCLCMCVFAYERL